MIPNPKDYYMQQGFTTFRRDEIIQEITFGGPDLAKMLGANPYSGGTNLDLYLEKKGLSEVEVNERMRMGLQFEQSIFNYYANHKAADHHVLIYNAEDLAYMNLDQSSWFRARPDGWIWDRNEQDIVGLIECKNLNEFSEKSWDLDGIPRYYQVQAQLYLSVFKLPFTIFVCCFGGNRVREFKYHSNYHSMDARNALAKKFKKWIEEETPPLNQTEHQYYDLALNKLYNRFNTAGPEKEDSTPVHYTKQFDQALANIAGLTIEKKNMEQAMKSAKNTILQYMLEGEHTVLGFHDADYNYARLHYSTAGKPYIKLS